MKQRNILTFLLGAAAGSLAVWFLNSKKGKQVRQDIREKFEHLNKGQKSNSAS